MHEGLATEDGVLASLQDRFSPLAPLFARGLASPPARSGGASLVAQVSCTALIIDPGRCGTDLYVYFLMFC